MTYNIARSVYSNRPRGFSTPAQLTFHLSTNPTIAPVSAENGVILNVHVRNNDLARQARDKHKERKLKSNRPLSAPDENDSVVPLS